MRRLAPFALIAIPLAALAAALAGCPAKPSGKPVICSTTSILGDLVARVGGAHVEVRVLAKPYDDVHTLAASPDRARMIAESRAVFSNGFGLEPWLDGLVKQAAGTHLTFQACKDVGPVGAANGVDLDPHAWLDPIKTIRYVENIRDMLITLDPAHETDFRMNADSLIERLRSLDAWIRTELEGVAPPRRWILSHHDSLRHFGARYGFNTVGLAPHGVTPSAQDIEAGIRFLEEHRLPAMFYEAGRDEEVMRTMSFKCGRRLMGPLFTDTLDAPGKPAGDYEGAMKETVRVLAEALR